MIGKSSPIKARKPATGALSLSVPQLPCKCLNREWDSSVTNEHQQQFRQHLARVDAKNENVALRPLAVCERRIYGGRLEYRAQGSD